MRSPAAALLVAALLVPAPALAQGGDSASTAKAEAAANLDLSKLGISVERVQRKLRDPQLDLEFTSPAVPTYRVEVFGQAPGFDLGDFDVRNGPVPGSGPTHRDMIELVTPKDYRASLIAAQSTVIFWAVKKLSERIAKQRCEARLEGYRSQLMAGTNATVPDCAR